MNVHPEIKWRDHSWFWLVPCGFSNLMNSAPLRLVCKIAASMMNIRLPCSSALRPRMCRCYPCE